MSEPGQIKYNIVPSISLSLEDLNDTLQTLDFRHQILLFGLMSEVYH